MTRHDRRNQKDARSDDGANNQRGCAPDAKLTRQGSRLEGRLHHDSETATDTFYKSTLKSVFHQSNMLVFCKRRIRDLFHATPAGAVRCTFDLAIMAVIYRAGESGGGQSVFPTLS